MGKLDLLKTKLGCHSMAKLQILAKISFGALIFDLNIPEGSKSLVLEQLVSIFDTISSQTHPIRDFMYFF